MPRNSPRRSTTAIGVVLWPPLIVAGCVVALLVALYTVYLDLRVRSQFQGARWSLPAKVYARSIDLHPGLRLTPARLQQELLRLGYGRDAQLAGPGSFDAKGGSVTIMSREFHFWDGVQPPRRLRVNFDDGKINGMTDLATGQPEQVLRLDPLLVGSIFQVEGEDRILVRIDDVPEAITEGLIYVEDREFHDHFGVDPKAIARALFANVNAGRIVQGGSTITQQLVKNFFLNRKQTYIRKAKEALMAVLLETHFSKDEILEAYLNEVYLGQDGARAIHGFGLGAHFYFQRPLNELKPHEIALLIAMVRGPSYYEPRRHPERATERRNLVLEQFAEAKLISADQLAQQRQMPLGIVENPPSGTTQYPAFVDLVRRQLRGQYREADLASEGLRIFTTLDPLSQESAEQRLTEGLRRLEADFGMRSGTLQGAAVVTSVEGGEVLALVGGRDAGFSGFNRALDARRPIGSLVKPAVYLAALNRPGEFNLVSLLTDEEIELRQPNGQVWAPQNYDHEYHGDEIPLYKALANSYNLPTVRTALQIGPAAVADTLQKLGYKGSPLAVPALALGTVDMAPLEVAQVYNTLAAGGYYTPLLAIREVTSRDGAPLSRYSMQLRQVYEEGPVYLLNWALQRVMLEGTARSAYSTLSPALNLAGKTGTTDDLRDSWFAGYSGNRLGVIWVGRDDYKPGKLSGATGALQIWARMMNDLPLEPFNPNQPAGVELVQLDPGNPDHDDEDCDQIMPVPFIKGSVPSDFEPCEGYASAEDYRGREPRRVRRERDDDEDSNWFLDIFR
ncbi:MAG: penicillin-binding protein 1B [Nevskiales bacterium]